MSYVGEVNKLKALNKIGHIAKTSSGISTIANAVKLAKELKPTLEMLQSFKREASYAFSSIGGTIVTKIPQGELIEAYYKLAESKDGKTSEPYDIVPYRPSNSPLENHHGVMDVRAKHNVPDYVSRGANTPTIALTKEQHNATKAVYRQWLFEKTGKKVGGKVDWKSVSPKEIQELTEKMFDAANVPRLARQEYYRAFNQYNFRE
ncbi:sugar-binding protein [Bacillus cereus]|nr:sugar-binding protein [Bacillus cereus]PFE38043.1 sugar-binding protein [Bacillus cereus]PFI72848.1 sugar-binding protein [Bacillus cereus]PFJ71091.1 sugar-binding protein [Bacillus cereus]PFK36541.1 sugar-binding protein [Bacillus cereus]